MSLYKEAILEKLRIIHAEEETLVAKMMAEQGNSVDFTAQF